MRWRGVYVRSKIVKGTAYYQIVEGRREGGRVRQRVVLALGRTPDPEAALKGMKRTLARLRRDQPYVSSPRRERLDASIAELETKCGMLHGFIKDGLVGTTSDRERG